MADEQCVKDDVYYMQEALKEAQAAYDLEEVPIGAVLVDNTTGEIVTRGHNMRKSGMMPRRMQNLSPYSRLARI